MALLKYWSKSSGEWKEVGVQPDGTKFVPRTGGTMDGPFPLIIESSPLVTGAADLTVWQKIDANGVTTSLDGTLDMAVRLESWASVDFNGAELTNISSSVSPDGAVSRFAVEATVADWTNETFTIGFSWAPASNIPAYRDPIVRKNREGLVVLGGQLLCVVPVTPGTNQPVLTLDTDCRPPLTQIHSSFCMMYGAAYIQVDINPQGEVYIMQGPDPMMTGTVISLDGISFYAEED